MDNPVTELEPSHDDAHSARGRISLPGEPPAFDHEVATSGLNAGGAERLAAAAAAGPPPDRPKVRRRIGRAALMGGVAVLAFSAGTAFVLSPYNTVIPVSLSLRVRAGQLASSAIDPISNLVAPAAKVAHASAPTDPHPHRDTASVPDPDQELREIIALRDRARTPTAGGAASGTPQPSPPFAAPSPAPLQDQSEPAGPVARPGASQPVRPAAATEAIAVPSPPVASAASLTPSRPVAAVVPPIAVATTPAAPTSLSVAGAFETGATPGPPERDVALRIAHPSTPEPAAMVPPPSPTAAEAAPSAPPAPVAIATAPGTPSVSQPSLSRPSPSQDPVQAAIALHAAPMSTNDQVEVLDAVAKLAIILRDIRSETAALKARLASSTDGVDAKIADFGRRLALAEARGALIAAMGGPSEAAAPDDPQPRDPVAPETITHPGPAARRAAPPHPVAQAVASTAAVPSAGPAPRYRVTAASPGLAMLALIDRSGGEGSQIQISVGDQVPGYGRVSAIQQRGAAWTVQTDKGVIQ